MFYVAQVLFIIFVLVGVFLITKKSEPILRFTSYFYYLALTITFLFIYYTNHMSDNLGEMGRTISIFGYLYIIPLIILIVIFLFRYFGNIENWQKAILVFASLVNGLLITVIFHRIFLVIFYQLP